MSQNLLETLFSLRNVFIYSSASFGLPSFLLYSSQVLLILRHPQFHNSFYALFLLRAIPDLAIVLCSYVNFRLPSTIGHLLLPIYLQFPKWLLASFHFLTYYTFEADNLATAFLLLNRFTAIAFPFHHKMIWRRLLPLAILITYGLPLYFLPYLFGMDAAVIVKENDPISGNRTTFVVQETEKTHFIADNQFLLFLTSLLFFFICLAINLAIFCVYKWKKRRFCNSSKQSKHKMNAKNSLGLDNVERKLLAYAICTSFGHGLVTILMVAFYIFIKAGNSLGFDAMLAQTTWVFDLSSILLPSWLLLWASTDFRKQWVDDFVPKIVQKMFTKKTKSTNIVNVPPFAVNLQISSSLQRNMEEGQVGQMQRQTSSSNAKFSAAGKSVPNQHSSIY